MSKDNKGPFDAPLKAAILSVAISGLALSFGALVLFNLRAALGVAVGGVIATVNLIVFARVIVAFLGQKREQTGPWVAVALLKLVLLFGGVWLILKSGTVSALALAVGYAALPLGITLGTLFGPKPKGDEDQVDEDEERP